MPTPSWPYAVVTSVVASRTSGNAGPSRTDAHVKIQTGTLAHVSDSSSRERGQSLRSRRERARSLSSLPSVWQRAQ